MSTTTEMNPDLEHSKDPSISLSDRIHGSMLGLAVTDALGAPVEFKARGSFPLVTEMRSNEHMNLGPGYFTDDTSMALCLAKSLTDNKGKFCPDDQARNYIKWYKDGFLSSADKCFDIGMATLRAVMIWSRVFKENPDASTEELLEKGQAKVDKSLKEPRSCGNGSLMRVAPIGLVYYEDMETAMRYARESSDVTHPYPTNAEACAAYTRLIFLALHGASKEKLVKDICSFDFKDADLKKVFDRYNSLHDFQQTEEESIKSSGYVVHTIEASLWAFFTTSTFKDGAIKVVNLGDDADTVGAVYGGLAGAFYGQDAIPTSWLEALVKKELVTSLADEILNLHKKSSG